MDIDPKAFYKARRAAFRLRRIPTYSTLYRILTDPTLPEAFLEAVTAIGGGGTKNVGRTFVRRCFARSLRPRAADPIKAICDGHKKRFGRRIEPDTAVTLLEEKRPGLNTDGNIDRALNLPLGRLTELIFLKLCEPLLAAYGLSLADVTTKRNGIDYTIIGKTLLNLNIKSAGLGFLTAEKNFPMSKEECHAIGGHKVVQGARLADPLLYVVMTDRDLPLHLFDLWLSLLNKAERTAYHHLANLDGARDLQDAFILATVDEKVEELLAKLGKSYGDFDFRVISARKLQELGATEPWRIWGVSGQVDGRNIHYSLLKEAQPFESFCAQHLATQARRRKLAAALKEPLPIAVTSPV